MAFEISLSSSDLQFSCAHFLVLPNGTREKLHGHNYRLSIRLTGEINTVDGYVLDNNVVKKAAREVCAHLNKKFLCPQSSTHFTVQQTPDTSDVSLKCSDGSCFTFPRSDCVLLPLQQTSNEELARYCFVLLVRIMTFDYLKTRLVKEIEVSVGEAAGEQASCRLEIPPTFDAFKSHFPEALISLPPAPRPPPGKPPPKNSVNSKINKDQSAPPRKSSSGLSAIFESVPPRPPGPPPDQERIDSPTKKCDDAPQSSNPEPPRGPPPRKNSNVANDSPGPIRPSGLPPHLSKSTSKPSTSNPKPPPGPPPPKNDKNKSSQEALASPLKSVDKMSQPPPPPPKKGDKNNTPHSPSGHMSIDNNELSRLLINHQLDMMVSSVDSEVKIEQLKVECAEARKNEKAARMDCEDLKRAVDHMMKEREDVERWRQELQTLDRTLQEEHEEQVRESQDLEANQRNLDASYSEMKQMRMDLENLSLALHKEKSDLERYKQVFLADSERRMQETLVHERQKMEQEFSVAMSKLQHDQREVDNRLISLEKAELELKAEHNSNISCLLELMRSLAHYKEQLDQERIIINQERLKLDFALRDLNHVKFNGVAPVNTQQKKSSAALSNLLTSVHTLNQSPRNSAVKSSTDNRCTGMSEDKGYNDECVHGNDNENTSQNDSLLMVDICVDEIEGDFPPAQNVTNQDDVHGKIPSMKGSGIFAGIELRDVVIPYSPKGRAKKELEV